MIHPSSPDEMQRHLLLYPEKWKRLWLFWLIYNKSWVDFDRQEINPSFLITIKQTGRAWHIVPFCLHESISQLVSTMSHLSRTWFSKFGIWIWKRTSPLSVCILQILYMFYTCFIHVLHLIFKTIQSTENAKRNGKRSSIIPLHPPNRSTHIILQLLKKKKHSPSTPQPYKKSHPKYSALEIFVPKHSWAPPPCTPSTRSQPPAIAKKRSARTEAVAWHRPIGNSVWQGSRGHVYKTNQKKETQGV